jgi:hypothetical protein
MDVIPYDMNKDQEMLKRGASDDVSLNYAVSPQKLKYTPLRSSRSPSASRSIKKKRSFGTKKPDYNQNYK